MWRRKLYRHITSAMKPIVIDEKYIQTESSEIVIEITNKKLDTRFQVYKYGTDTKKPLAGAVFEITDEDGDLLQTLTTNSKGIAEKQNRLQMLPII